MKTEKRRILSEEDLSIWDTVSKTFDKQLKHAKFNKILKNKDDTKLIIKNSNLAKTLAQTFDMQKVKPDYVKKRFVSSQNFLGQNLDKKRKDLLKKGKISPEKFIDLHGLTARKAEIKVIAFLKSSYAQGFRLVLIITGKGKNSFSSISVSYDDIKDSGILKRSLFSWLRNSEVMHTILQIMPAHAKHGGGGAFYVYLRKNNNL